MWLVGKWNLWRKGEVAGTQISFASSHSAMKSEVERTGRSEFETDIWTQNVTGDGELKNLK